MITLDIWLPQILNYCILITDDNAVKRAWFEGNFSDTSVSSFDELYEQIFDDLDSDNFELESVGLREELVRSIRGLLRSLHEVDAMIENTNASQPEDIIVSTQWRDLKIWAASVLLEASKET
jgi:hypothetical protein